MSDNTVSFWEDVTQVPEVEKQIKQAYRAMAKRARYRPAAPSDGFGHITVPDTGLDLEAEAEDYARRWWAEEHAQTWDIGCCDVDTRPATIFAVEAAREMCAGFSGNPQALKLLKMAFREIEAS